MTLYGEGSSASSTNEELWRAGNSFLRVREIRCPEVSGELIPQNERELTFLLFLFLSWLCRKFPPNLGQVEFTVVTGELERNERACLSLTCLSLTLAAGGGGA